MHAIEIENVTKTFGAHSAVEALSLRVPVFTRTRVGSPCLASKVAPPPTIVSDICRRNAGFTGR
jgi:hypothetical protein